jgi:hypothetical protein
MGFMVVDLQLGGAGDGVCPPRAAVSGGFCPCLFCRQLFFGFIFFPAFVLCIPLVSLEQYACVLLKFY